MDAHITFGIFMKYVVTCATLVLIAKFAFETLQVYIKLAEQRKKNMIRMIFVEENHNKIYNML